MREFVKTTLIGGLLFLIPLVAIVAVIGKAYQILEAIATPMADVIPVDSLGGFALAQLLTITIMIAACLAAGLIARSNWGRTFYEKIDTLLLRVIPGYSWVKGVTGEISDEEAASVFKPVLVRLDDQHQLGLEAERTTDGLVAVFFPGSPDIRSGALAYVTADRVTNIDVKFGEFSKAFSMLGRNSLHLVSR